MHREKKMGLSVSLKTLINLSIPKIPQDAAYTPCIEAGKAVALAFEAGYRHFVSRQRS